MPLVEYSCPRCKPAGIMVQLSAGPGGIVCPHNSSHHWVDTASFYAEKPSMDFPVQIAGNLPQGNHEPVTITLPRRIKEAFEAKYGSRASATMASLATQLVEGDVMVVGATDLERLGRAELLGRAPQSSSELVGMVYDLKMQVDEARAIAANAASDLKAYEGTNPGAVIVGLGDSLGAARERAKDANLPLKIFIERCIRDGLENNWF